MPYMDPMGLYCNSSIHNLPTDNPKELKCWYRPPQALLHQLHLPVQMEQQEPTTTKRVKL